MEKIVKISVGGVLAALVAAYFLFSSQPNDEVLATIPARAPSDAAIEIIAFGDSLTAGYGLPAGESYPAQLEAALRANGHDVSIINAGVSGETTRGNLERAKFIREQNPDIVLLGIGGNDALRALPIADTIKNITDTVTILQSGEQPPVVMLLQMQSPLNAGLAYKREFDAMYEEIASTYDLILVPFITTEVFLERTNKLPDGIHLNKTGYGKVVDLYLLQPVTDVVEKIGG